MLSSSPRLRPRLGMPFLVLLLSLGHPGHAQQPPEKVSLYLISDETAVQIVPNTNNKLFIRLQLSVPKPELTDADLDVPIEIVAISKSLTLLSGPTSKVTIPSDFFQQTEDPAIFEFDLPIIVTCSGPLLKEETLSIYAQNDVSHPHIVRVRSNPDCCDEDDSILCYSPTQFKKLIKPKEIIFDFKSKLLAFPKGSERLKRGDAVRIKVVNFNPFLYQVNINGTDSTAQGVVDNNNLLSAFTNLSNLSTIVGGLGTAGAGGAAATPPSTNFAQTYSWNALTPAQKKDASEQQGRLDSVFDSHTVLMGRLSARFRKLRQEVYDRIYDFDHYFKAQRYLYPTCTDFAILASRGPQIKAEFRALQIQISQLYTDIGVNQRAYLNSTAHYASLFRDKTEPGFTYNKFRDSLIRTYYISATNNINTCDSILSYKVLTVVEETIDRMKDVKPIYLSSPIFLQGDSKVFSIGLSPWSDSLNLQTYANTTFELPWTQHSIFGINAGVYLAYLPTNNYAVKPSDTSTSAGSPYQIVNDKAGSMEVGIDALAYVAWKLNYKPKDYSYLGPAFGAAMSICSAPKPRLMIGGTYIYGRVNRLVISGGLIGGYSQTLSSAYELNTNYLTSSPPNGYTKNMIKAGGFLSIGYSFIN